MERLLHHRHHGLLLQIAEVCEGAAVLVEELMRIPLGISLGTKPDLVDEEGALLERGADDLRGPPSIIPLPLESVQQSPGPCAPFVVFRIDVGFGFE